LTVQARGKDLIAIARDAAGDMHISSQGHLVLPLPVRRHCGLHSADRLFIAAHRDRTFLLIMTATAMTDVLNQLLQRRLLGT
jgi:bifunctional DNA-binding transcriptional regulator/antitoxin component of YhaV-PrlF toxin-antitoxin module